MKAIGLILLSFGLFLANTHGADLLDGGYPLAQTNQPIPDANADPESRPGVPVPAPNLWEGGADLGLGTGTTGQRPSGLAETPRPLRELLTRIDPFGPAEPPQPRLGTGDTNPRAWTTQVGWHPGVSDTPDPVTHESNLKLLSFSGGRVRVGQ